MKYKKINLEWNVLNWDNNLKKIKSINILDDDLKTIIYKKIRSKKIKNYKELKEFLNRRFQYHYWSRCEYEIAIGSIFMKDIIEAEKIDVYDQIKINLDRITEYIINKMEIKF